LGQYGIEKVDMNKGFRLKMGKCVVSVVWLLIIVAVVAPSQLPFPSVLYAMGVFLVVSHIYEIVISRNIMRGPLDYLGIFFFGLLHIWTIRHEYTIDDLGR